MMQLVTLLMLLVTTATAQQAATGAIKGTITTSDGEPGAFVSIQIKETNRGTVANEKGEYVFRKVAPGSYTLQMSLMGHEAVEQQVTVTAGSTAVVNIRLQLSNTQLSEVKVQGVQNRMKKESDYVARLPIKNLENPQVYNVVSKELMKEQVITTVDDALKNAPGVNRLWSSTGRPGDGAGYFSMRGFSIQPSMVNGIAGISNGNMDPANIERIETIKGPSGTLFGSSLISFGGLINIVTKRPYDVFGGELSYTGGTFGLNRLTADINTPLTKDKSVLLRTNAAYHYEGSFQDAGFRRSFFVAPSLSYKVNDRLSFLVNTEIYNGESTNTLMVFLNRARPLIAKTPAELGIDFNRSFTSNDLTYKTPTVNVMGQANYKLSDKWTSQTTVSRSNRSSRGYYSYVMFLDAGSTPYLAPNDSILSRFAYHQQSTSITTDVQQNFTGDFKIGSLRNRVVAGIDFLSIKTDNNNSPYLLFDSLSAVNTRDPRYIQLNRQSVDAKLAASKGAPIWNTNTSYTYSAYVSDVLNVTDWLIAMASIRVDHFDTKGTQDFVKGTTTGTYSQTSVSPKFGLIFQPLKDRLSLFANYMNGFRNLPPAAPTAPELTITIKPQQANQIEGGVKYESANRKLNLTASYYNILVTNMVRTASATINGTPYNYSIQDGSQRSKGVEVDLSANPLPGLNIIAGYGYNDSKMEQSDKFVLGRRPTTAGPAHLANAWISYTIPSGPANGLGAGLGGNYASENIITNDLRTGQFILPAYTILNASIFYNAKAYRLALKLDNLTNKEYFGGWTTVEKQMPRRLSANVSFRF
ncbi:TonB-dependent receptor [Chitinophaga sp. Mgbs1]|uniref:TonB-dependent receptor n=1 Tax=Chitinophaga solisilvae TaxID=1233460 RepID=A0A433W975_9BACT|nr:TonB-dependent receptor [Chitinophaga solisilvae]